MDIPDQLKREAGSAGRPISQINQSFNISEHDMTTQTTTTDPTDNVQLPVGDAQRTKELLNLMWSIYLLSFFSQVLSIFIWVLNTPGATWQIAITMGLMACQNTIVGGAIKIVTKKLNAITDDAVKKSADLLTEREINLEMKAEIASLQEQVSDREAEILAIKSGIKPIPSSPDPPASP
jgi:hypothetical protein